MLFMKETACRIFVDTLLHYRDQGAYLLHTFVLMPEHFHVLLTSAGGMTLERAVQFIKGGSAHAIRKELPSRVPVWQRGFSDHRIRDRQDYETHLRYIEQNPVKRRLVFAAEEYQWSSASDRFRMDEPPQGLKPCPDERQRMDKQIPRLPARIAGGQTRNDSVKVGAKGA